jgi:hypothetical protein
MPCERILQIAIQNFKGDGKLDADSLILWISSWVSITGPYRAGELVIFPPILIQKFHGSPSRMKSYCSSREPNILSNMQSHAAGNSLDTELSFNHLPTWSVEFSLEIRFLSANFIRNTISFCQF